MCCCRILTGNLSINVHVFVVKSLQHFQLIVCTQHRAETSRFAPLEKMWSICWSETVVFSLLGDEDGGVKQPVWVFPSLLFGSFSSVGAGYTNTNARPPVSTSWAGCVGWHCQSTVCLLCCQNGRATLSVAAWLLITLNEDPWDWYLPVISEKIELLSSLTSEMLKLHSRWLFDWSLSAAITFLPVRRLLELFHGTVDWLLALVHPIPSQLRSS